MKITRVEVFSEAMPLTRPYTIAFRTISDVEMTFVVLHGEKGLLGMGCASPEPHVTGETRAACREALDPAALKWLEREDVLTLPRLARRAGEQLVATPAARAAVDMALHDLLACHLGRPLVDLLGRAHEALPTSITIGIKGVEETLEEAREQVGQGFRVLKVKLGHSLEEDIARLARLREALDPSPVIRVDPNQGYSADEVTDFVERTSGFGIEFLEQPMRADDVAAMRSLPESLRDRVAADETLLNEKSALDLVMPPRACGIFNIKLMKCGGISAARRIADIADTAGIELMWGCMDESIVSISAALHAAFASPATRYLDLDGSLDLARDVVSGGFTMTDGVMRTVDAPGLGVRRL
jgi:L-alanine-DL-glutamate epimerase-like enolase superfamily enzyme